MLLVFVSSVSVDSDSEAEDEALLPVAVVWEALPVALPVAVAVAVAVALAVVGDVFEAVVVTPKRQSRIRGLKIL